MEDEQIWSVEVNSYTQLVRAPNAQVAGRRAILRMIEARRVHVASEDEIAYYLDATGRTSVDEID